MIDRCEYCEIEVKRLDDFDNELLEYCNVLAERINLLADAIIALNVRTQEKK